MNKNLFYDPYCWIKLREWLAWTLVIIGFISFVALAYLSWLEAEYVWNVTFKQLDCQMMRDMIISHPDTSSLRIYAKECL